MKRLESKFAKKWVQSQNTIPFYTPQHLDINCGACSRSQVGMSLAWQKVGKRGFFTEFQCRGCESLNRLLLLEPPQAIPQKNSELEKIEFYQHPSGITATFDEEIKSLSPKYVEIYSQAEQAEQLDLYETVGCGYRRALEILVKDFLINHKYQDNPEEQEKVRNPKFPLGKAIRELGDPGIIESAEAAAWLGNDKTHYTERHNATVEDLKGFVNFVVSYMKLQLIREKMKNK